MNYEHIQYDVADPVATIGRDLVGGNALLRREGVRSHQEKQRKARQRRERSLHARTTAPSAGGSRMQERFKCHDESADS